MGKYLIHYKERSIKDLTPLDPFIDWGKEYIFNSLYISQSSFGIKFKIVDRCDSSLVI